MNEPRLTACIRCEIVKPLSHDWPQLQACLRRLRHGTQRALNAASTDLVIQTRTKLPERPAQSYAYESVKVSAEQTDTPMPGAMASVVARFAFQANQRYWKDIKRRISRTLPSFGRNAPIFVRADNWRMVVDSVFDPIKGKARLVYAIEMKLEPGRDPSSWYRVGVAFDGGSAFATARKLVTPGSGYKLGDLKLKWNEKKRKWLALIAFSWPKPTVTHSGDLMAVHRGIRNMLYACFADDKGRTIMDGGDVLAHKKQMLARARSLGRHRPELGDGAHGHGVRRRDATLIRLRDAEERFAKTKMQQAAARMVKEALATGSTMIVIEDYGTIDDGAGDKYAEKNGERVAVEERTDIPWIVKRWPWAAQREAVEWAARKGLCEVCGKPECACEERKVKAFDVLAIPPEFNAQTCPDCGCVEAKNDTGRGVFRCQKCDYERPVDYVTSLNMRRRAEQVLKDARVDDGAWTMVLIEPGKKTSASNPYLPVYWLTEGLAQKALDDILKPYPEGSEWRKRLKIMERKVGET